MYFKHGAVLYQGKKIISKGHNKTIVKDVIFNSIHAEMSAIKNAKQLKIKRSNNLTMYVVRINRNGVFLNSKPCEHCQKIMKSFGVHKCIYSSTDGEMDCIVFT
jgi:tRNA(Arg) A34 adenosine deaminase TadA